MRKAERFKEESYCYILLGDRSYGASTFSSLLKDSIFFIKEIYHYHVINFKYEGSFLYLSLIATTW